MPEGSQDTAFAIGEEMRLRMERSHFESRWEKIRALIWPDSGQIRIERAPGLSNRQEVLDNTAEDACEMAAAGLHGLLTNPATQWFHLSLMDTDIAERDAPARWLEEATRRVANLFAYAPSKFNVASYDCYTEAIALANWCMFVEERMGELPLFRPISIGNVVWDEDDNGDLVRVFRRLSRPLWAVHRKFGGRLPKRLAKLHESRSNWSKRIPLLHVVEPRELYDPGKLNARNKPWRSCWIDCEGAQEIHEGGFDEMPYICGRWRTLPDEIYGRGCGDKALPDTALLQRGTESLYKAAEVATRPPMMVPDEGMVKRLNLRPAAINYIRSDMIGRKEVPQPLITGARTDITEELLLGVRDRIKRAFLRDLLQLIRDPEATATQVLELKEEQMRGMSPILARITQDWLGPLVMRTFSCAQRAGAFRDLPPPKEIVGLPPRPIFVSPAARAQQISEARGISQAFDATAPLLQMEPDVADNVDVDKAFRLVFKAVGTPLSIMRSPEVRDERRKAKAQVLEQQQREESLKNVTTGLKNATPALKLAAEQQAAA